VLFGRVMQRILSVLLLCARIAAADERSNAAREHYQKGTTAFDLGQFEEAVREYTEAYRLRDEPVLLYNIAQANRLAGHKAESLHFYRIYLTKLPHAPNHDEVAAKIAELQKAIEQEKRAQTMPPNESIQPGAKAPSPPQAAPEEKKPQPIVLTPKPMTIDRGGRKLKIAGGIVAGAGVALAIGGLVSSLLAKSAADNLAAEAGAHQPYDPAQYSALQTNRIAGPVLLGIGGAALIGGVAVIAVGAKRKPLIVQVKASGISVGGKF
jgi:tetratricopeptide (TPR) repeat protein